MVSSSPASIIAKIIVGLDIIYFWYVAQYVFLKSVREQFPFPVIIMILGIAIGAAGYEKDKSSQGALTGGIIVMISGMFYLWQEIANMEVTIPGFVIIIVGVIIFEFY